MSLEIRTTNGKTFFISSDAVPLLGNIKSSQEPLNVGTVKDNIIDILCQFVDEYSRMGITEKKLYDDPRNWSNTSSEYSWYMKVFGDMPMSDVIELTNLVQTLGFETMMNICCFHIANQIRGKTPNEMRALLNIDSDFSLEEEENLAKENSWYIGIN
jgi:S-phase kinase-associated protein 1